MEIYSVIVVEKNPVPKSQTKPFYIGTKEAPSDFGATSYGTPSNVANLQLLLNSYGTIEDFL